MQEGVAPAFLASHHLQRKAGSRMLIDSPAQR